MQEFPLWTKADPAGAHLPLTEAFQYKYVICDENGSPVRWEERGNRFADLGALVSQGLARGTDKLCFSEAFNTESENDRMRFRPCCSNAPTTDMAKDEQLKGRCGRSKNVISEVLPAMCVTSVPDSEKGAAYCDKTEAVECPTVAEKLKTKGVAWRCKKGMKPESFNQDSFSVLYVEGQFALYGVYDGHGPKGHHVSNIARQYLVHHFVHHEKREASPSAAFMDSFSLTQQALSMFGMCELSGTTCTMAYHDFEEGTLTIAHVGDSRAILGSVATDKTSSGWIDGAKRITEDHKPELPAERARIENALPPGRVIYDGYACHRVYAQKDQLPGLNMSRALGDCYGQREAGLSSEPDIATIKISEEIKEGDQIILVIASDGVWEFVNPSRTVDILRSTADLEVAASVLCLRSFDEWMAESQESWSDDITAILVRLS